MKRSRDDSAEIPGKYSLENKKRELGGESCRIDPQDLLAKVSKPDIQEIAEKYPNVREYVQDGGYFDYSSLEANYVLAETLLECYFDLSIKLSRDHLCPRIANRLDYVLWICRVAGVGSRDSITAIDIGVGASCIYPLLLTSVLRGCTVYGLDINDGSIDYAASIVRDNGLRDRIKLIKKHPSPILGYDCEQLQSVFENPVKFTMCNPPFYSSIQELQQSSQVKIQGPTTPLTAADSELFTSGGEEQFTLQMLKESLQHSGGSGDLRGLSKVEWFSTMVGKLSTLETLVQELRNSKIDNYAIHQINHGKTRRWTIAWSFGTKRVSHDVDARSQAPSLKSLNPPLTESVVESSHSLSRSVETIRELLKGISGRVEDMGTGFFVSVPGNVWSRAYRRQKIAKGGPSSFRISVRDCVDVRQIHIKWANGSNYAVYDSFVGMISKASVTGQSTRQP
uniref:ARAD1A17270p n=1 Tax=Blastobotrys adeninivorans TaxID=409370 RepID=A0A060T3M9_BLAAD